LQLSWPLLLVLVSLLGSTTAWADDTAVDARALLERMQHAARNLNYQGVLVFQRGDRLVSMRIFHQVGPEGGTERLVSLNGETREVVRKGDRVTCVRSDEHPVTLGRGRSVLSARFQGQGSGLEEHYDLAVSGTDRVAERSTHVVEILARDLYRYGYRLSLDEETGLLLKSELLGPEGNSLEQMLYTSIEITDSIPDELLRPSVHVNAPEERPYESHRPNEAGETPWLMGWLPPGFILHARDSGPPSHAHSFVEHLVFSDGLGSFSVYVEAVEDGGQRLEGPSQMGAIHAFGNVRGDHHVTVVGEVPGITVKEVAQAVRPGGE
jgi:sigma-E factor negative regulatory protein RseB